MLLQAFDWLEFFCNLTNQLTELLIQLCLSSAQPECDFYLAYVAF